jgi:hypothetical protein
MSAPLHFSQDFYDKVFATHKKMADFAREVGKKLRLRVSFYNLCTKFLAKNSQFFYIFKSAEVIEAVRLGGTPT